MSGHLEGLTQRRRPHVLIVVQNLPVPLDRRVWQEAQSLIQNGYRVSVICPKGPGDPSRQRINSVDIYKYNPAREACGLVGFAWEFVYSWLRTAWLSMVVWSRGPFDVFQACNPPDTYWALARIWKLRGVKFVFDQHDLNPELFLSRFGVPCSAKAKALLGGLRWLERRTYAAADHVISTNDFYREIAMCRGKRTEEDISVVRSGPDTRRMRPVIPPPSIRKRSSYLLTYIGIMGPQDTVDQLIDLMHELVTRRGRDDIHLNILGFGDCLEDLKSETTERGLDSVITFTGRVGPAEIADYLSAADLGVGPDLKTPLNDISTMNKTLEFMAYALPQVAYELAEVGQLVGDAGVLVPSGDVVAFADAVETLLADDESRVRMGLRARERVVKLWDWRAQSGTYVEVFDRLTGGTTGMPGGRQAAMSAMPHQGDESPDREYVDLEDTGAFADFVRNRGCTNPRADPHGSGA